jgi:signal transduction histidine kinase
MTEQEDKRQILVVDDELGPREALRIILKDRYAVHTAVNGQEACEFVREHPVHLVIMDIKMPVMDGMEALKQIKEYDPFVGVIMVTGYGTIDTAVEAMKEGAYDFINKPFDTLEILDVVKKALGDMEERKEALRMITDIQQAGDRLNLHQQQLQQQLVQLSKLSTIGMLAQGLAHNLSSPLLIILGRAELMKDKLVGLRTKLANLTDQADRSALEPLFREYDQSIRDTDIIIENVNKLSATVRDMMNKSRKDQAQTKERLNLSEVLWEQIKFLEADLFFKHQVEKLLELDENLPAVPAVYSDFSQAFLNMIQNAVEAMAASPVKRLTVQSSHDAEQIQVVIHDTGCGIPEEHLDRIFQPYFSTKKDLSDLGSASGTGLGLHLVEILLHPYDASIEVRSKPGDTSFIVKIPYEGNADDPEGLR